MCVLGKTSSHVSASAKTSSHKTVSRKTSHDTTESPKKPEISTSIYIYMHTRVCIRSYTNVEITSLNFLVVYCHFTLNAPDLT